MGAEKFCLRPLLVVCQKYSLRIGIARFFSKAEHFSEKGISP